MRICVPDFLFVTLLSLGCATGRPFVNSTLDFNNGQAHKLTVSARIHAVADTVASIMTTRGALLVKRRVPQGGSVVLSFRHELERQTGSISTPYGRLMTEHNQNLWVNDETKNVFVDYGSLYYVELTARADHVDIVAVGLPSFEGRTACPELVRQRYRDCKPAQASSSEGFAKEMETANGIRADGAREADMVTGLLAELQVKYALEAE